MYWPISDRSVYLQGWLMLISHRKVKQETVVISLGLYLWSPYGLAIPFGLGINSTIRSDEEKYILIGLVIVYLGLDYHI